MKKPILFVVGSEPAYRVHKLFAEYCAKQGRPLAFLYDSAPDAFFETLTKDAQALGATVASLDAAIQPGPHEPPWGLFRRPSDRVRLFEQVRKQSTSPRIRAFTDLIFGRLDAARTILKQVRPSAIVVAEDGIAGPMVLMAAARELGIPIIDLPYGHGTQRDLEVSLERKQADGELQYPEGPEGEAITKHAPEWIKRGPFEGVLLFPSDYIVVLESAGVHFRHCWSVHGGLADRLMVESPRMMALYREEGIPDTKLVLVGSVYGGFLLDSIAGDDAARAAFRQPKKIAASPTRVLVSWPPSYHSERAEHSEFASYADMTRAFFDWIRTLSGVQLTVSLHPAVSADDRAMIADLGVVTTDDYILSLIPRHDIYVTYFSSTIRWAIASGKPVVNYDAYKIALPVYDAAPGVVTTAAMAEAKKVIGELVSSEDAFGRLAERQVAVAAEWGVLDARAMPKILAELDAVVRG